jgi:hypothetical protein
MFKRANPAGELRFEKLYQSAISATSGRERNVREQPLNSFSRHAKSRLPTISSSGLRF